MMALGFLQMTGTIHLEETSAKEGTTFLQATNPTTEPQMQTSRVAEKLRAQIHQFLGIFSPHFSRPKLKFLEQMLYGVSASQDCKLSQVARVLGES